MLLESFRLPGESQQIERIMEAFASGYFALKPDHLVNQDAAFILSYSIIMLNTDQVFYFYFYFFIFIFSF